MIKVLKLIVSDWKRYTNLHKKVNVFLFLAIFFNNPGMFFSVIYRIENYFITHPFLFLKLIGYFFYPMYFIITYYILDFNIPPTVKIGKSLYMHNRGIIFTNFVKAGDNMTLIGPLTIGLKGVPSASSQLPSIGNNVIIFTGARIIGDIKINDNVYVGANAVVVKNVPSNSVVGGVPARLIKKLNKIQIQK